MPCLTDILGQDQAIQVLRRAVQADKLAHAYLFCGPLGVGKATSAVRLAAALNCENVPGEGCETCLSCHKIQQGIHPDLVVICPDGQFIKIDQVRALEEHLAFAPHEGRYRVVVIDGADHLNLNAANALLKSVEEPRPRTLFVLVASAGHQVAPTLVSRCQRIRFLPLREEHLLSIVDRCTDAAEHQRRDAVALAEGSAKQALQLLEGDQMADIQRICAALQNASSGNSVLAIFEAAAEAGRDRQLLRETLDVMRVWLRDVLLCNEGLEKSGNLVNAHCIDRLKAEAERTTWRGIVRQLRAVDEAQAALKGNVHPALALENLALNMHRAVSQ